MGNCCNWPFRTPIAAVSLCPHADMFWQKVEIYHTVFHWMREVIKHGYHAEIPKLHFECDILTLFQPPVIVIRDDRWNVFTAEEYWINIPTARKSIFGACCRDCFKVIYNMFAHRRVSNLLVDFHRDIHITLTYTINKVMYIPTTLQHLICGYLASSEHVDLKEFQHQINVGKLVYVEE